MVVFQEISGRQEARAEGARVDLPEGLCTFKNLNYPCCFANFPLAIDLYVRD